LVGAPSDVGTPATCTIPLADSLQVVRGSTTNTQLFVREPALSVTGDLEFQIAENQFGAATFSVMMKSPSNAATRRLLDATAGNGYGANLEMTDVSIRDGAASSSRHTLAATSYVPVVSFTIDVRVPRYLPSFRPVEVVLLEDADATTLVFAMDVRSGVQGNSKESILSLTWSHPEFMQQSPVMFGIPALRTQLVGGQLVGTVALTPLRNLNGNFSMFIYLDDRASNLTSTTMEVPLLIVPVNDPPTAKFRSGTAQDAERPPSEIPRIVVDAATGAQWVSLLQDSGTVNISGFVEDIRMGPDDEERVT
jgi:hypothetical protein